MLRLEDEYGLISAAPAFWLARTFSRVHFVDKAEHLDRRISASLLDICSSSSAHAYVIDRKHAPIGLSAVPGAAKALTWYLGPTRVAARGKMRSSGSVRSRIRHLQRLPATPARAGPLRTERVFRKRVQSVQIPRRNAAHPVSLALDLLQRECGVAVGDDESRKRITEVRSAVCLSGTVYADTWNAWPLGNLQS